MSWLGEVQVRLRKVHIMKSESPQCRVRAVTGGGEGGMYQEVRVGVQNRMK